VDVVQLWSHSFLNGSPSRLHAEDTSTLSPSPAAEQGFVNWKVSSLDFIVLVECKVLQSFVKLAYSRELVTVGTQASSINVEQAGVSSVSDEVIDYVILYGKVSLRWCIIELDQSGVVVQTIDKWLDK